MTNDYKETLLKYFTGNLSNENKSNVLNYEELITNNSDVYISDYYEIVGYIQCKDSNGNLNGKTIVYGNINQTYDEGFIALFKGTELVYVATKYNTGTTFGKFKYLDVDESGNYYGIDYYNEQFRIILLNNISELGLNGSSQIILRNSYYLRGNIASLEPNYSKFFVKKSLQSASYLIIGTNSDYRARNVIAILFKINVGAENEWIPYTSNIDFSQIQYFEPLGYYVYFDKDDVPFIEYYAEVNKYNNMTSLSLYTNTDTTLGNEEILYQDLSDLILGGNDGYYYGTISLMTVASRTFYFCLGDINNQNKPIMSCLKYENGTSRSVFYITTQEGGTYNSLPEALLFNLDNIPIIYYVFPIEASSQTMPYEKSQGIGILTSKMINATKELPNLATEGGIYSRLVLVNKAYNMLNMSSIYYNTDVQNSTQKISTWKVVYNPINYNGEPYENKNSLVGNNVMLFDNENSLIFARNLYNYKVYNNRVISVLNVPNTYLNDVIINKESLLSETNTELMAETNSITKNIYEELFINFFLTLKMVNKNDPIEIENKSGAIRINQSASKINDYENAKATKVRINYTDGTSLLGGASATIENNIATYQITLYTGNKDIESIEIISEDENTVYQAIKGLNLEHNKYYNIKQDVYIE